MAAPPGSLTRAHLARARHALSTLDLILESNAPRTPLALQYATGIANFTSCRAPSSAPKCAMLRGKQGLYGRPARPKRLIGRGWPKLGVA